MTSDYPERYKDLCESLLWRSKPTRWQTWLKRLSKVKWLSRLCGRTLKPSRRKSFEAALTSSLRESPASRGQLQENRRESKTKDGCGTTSIKSLSKSNRPVFSLRKSLGLFEEEVSVMCYPTLPKQGTMRNGVIFPRRKSELRTKESDCLSWRSPSGSDGEGGIMENLEGKDGRYKLRDQVNWNTPSVSRGGYTQPDGTSIPKLDQQVKLWPTPNVPNRGPESKASKAKRPNTGGIDLQTEVRDWPTPTCPGPHQVGKIEEWGGSHNQLRNTQPAPDKSNTNGKNRGQLNPNWVEQLMGLRVGWTDLDY